NLELDLGPVTGRLQVSFDPGKAEGPRRRNTALQLDELSLAFRPVPTTELALLTSFSFTQPPPGDNGASVLSQGALSLAFRQRLGPEALELSAQLENLTIINGVISTPGPNNVLVERPDLLSLFASARYQLTFDGCCYVIELEYDGASGDFSLSLSLPPFNVGTGFLFDPESQSIVIRE
ncbi:MAG: hypothetical protein HY335_05065, partial [Deinococcus sp.]|nr:hypothetical protein [Deinococcus sp.]